MISPKIPFSALIFAACSTILHAEEMVVPADARDSFVVESRVDKAFDFETVESEARELAAKPYATESDKVPPYFLNLSYDEFRDIRYIPAMAQWKDSDAAFRAQFFHAGLFHNRVAKIYSVESGKARELPYDRSRYDFGKLQVPPETAYPNGYAGFRWHGEVNTPGVWDEFAVFVGASYFRCVPTRCGATYGLSARGLAVNTAAPGIPEDFPFFKKFWLERPLKNTRHAVAYALMDSPNVSGAFRFEIWPGKKVVTKVKSTVFIRNKVERLGIAPFSSMFWYGENSTARPADFRPEVHDSDGLLIEEHDGRRHWRPLLNDPRELRHSVFAVGKAKAFGLRQRDLVFSHYEDLEAWYHKRPGVWVTPGAEWPEGSVHLMELTTGEETWDNVVAYWQPARIPGPGESLKLEYSIMWAMEPEFNDPLARVTGTHVGGRDKQPGVVHYVVDFSKIPGESNREDAPALVTEAYGDAKVVYSQIYYNAETRGWRVIVDVKAAVPAGDSGKQGAPKFLRQGLRAWLERDGRGVSERWDYRPSLVEAPAPEVPANPTPAVAMPGPAPGVKDRP